MRVNLVIVPKCVGKDKPLQGFKVYPFVLIHSNLLHRPTTYASNVFTDRISKGLEVSINIGVNIKDVLLIDVVMKFLKIGGTK